MQDIKREPPFIRTPYNYDMDLASDESSLHCTDGSLTDQSFKEECDINTLIKRFGLGMEMPMDFRIPHSGDFTDQVTDFHTGMNLLREAQESFMQLPAHMRERFGNDPGNLIGFLEDEKNREEAIELGLVNPPPPKAEPLEVRVVPEAPAQSAT